MTIGEAVKVHMEEKKKTTTMYNILKPPIDKLDATARWNAILEWKLRQANPPPLQEKKGAHFLVAMAMDD